ncbi:hypothetical protein JCM15831A_09790 [Asaia astilbis]
MRLVEASGLSERQSESTQGRQMPGAPSERLTQAHFGFLEMAELHVQDSAKFQEAAILSVRLCEGFGQTK